jgi:heavy metal efflux system protein
MLNSILRFSIRNKLIVGLLTLGLVVWGGWSATQLPIDAVPDITNNQVQVITVSPSLAAQETERLITAPVELALANIPGIIELRSFSRFGLSLVTVVFTDETDVYWARQQLTERLQTVRDQIPPGVGIPTLAPVTTGLGEIFQYTLIPKKGYESRYNTRDLRTIQDWIVRRQLLGTPGVADVSSFGGELKQYQIAVNPDQLRANNLSISDLFTALEHNNQNTGGAYIDKKPNAYFIRADGLLGTTDDIGNVVIRLGANNAPVRIRDVASVQIGSAVRYGAVTRNGTGEVVGAVVMMLKGENSSVVIKRVKAKIAEIEKTLPEGVALVPFLDRTKMVNSAIGTVTRNLTEGALIVIFVLVLLLGDWRAGVVVASVIPLAMLFAIGLMHTFGVSGNLMSLGAIDFGLIVDGAVIIVEATMHHLGERVKERAGERAKERTGERVPTAGLSTLSLSRSFTLSQSQMDEEVFSSSAKIRNSAAFGEIIILIVYLPILALSGIEGKMFRPMAITVGFAILGAFILSLTYVPMMSSVLLSKHIRHRVTWSSRMISWLQRRYEPLLLLALRRRLMVIGVAVTLLIISVLAFLQMGGEFIPALDEGDFAVDTRVLTGSSLSETVEATLKAERVFLTFPEVEQVVAKIGSGEIPTDPMPIEASDLMIIFKPMEQWTSAKNREEMVEKMAAAASVIPGVTFGFQQPVQMRFNELMTGSRQDVGIKIYGDDLTELTRLAEQLATQIKTVSGAKDLYVEQVEGLPQILVKLNRDRIAQYGLNVTDVNRTINTAFAGQSAGLIFEGERRYDLVVRLAENKRQSLEDVQNLYVTAANGQQIPLSQIADVRMVLAPNQIQRDNTRRRITVGFNVRGRDVESMVNELQQKVDAKIKFPPGYSVQYGGQFQNLIEAKTRLSIAVPGALALIFMLLFFTFGSVKQSLLIFTAIPFAAIGGVAALLLRGMPFSISAGVGFIALFGVAVLNGIVLIAEFNRQRLDEANKTLHDVIVKAAEIRLRPVVLTALVASLGFLPMALSNSAGAEVQKPLATVVIGGLITATLLTLIVLPVLYTYFEGKTKPKPVPQNEVI